MERKSKLRGAIGEVKKNIHDTAEEVRSTVNELKETVREAVPRPLRRRVQTRIENITLPGRRRKRVD